MNLANELDPEAAQTSASGGQGPERMQLRALQQIDFMNQTIE